MELPKHLKMDLAEGGVKSRTKAFKDYDQKFRKWKHKLLPGEHLDQDVIKTITEWVHMSWYAVHSHEEVRKVVYELPGHEDWQRFRVSLKGWSTQVKLYRLDQRLKAAMLSLSEETLIIEKMRINNYIGALIRGGFLDSKGKILK